MGQKIKGGYNMENLKINCEVELTELERVKKELEETKKKYRDLSNLIVSCSVEIDKTLIILEHWIQEYGFYEKPDPWAAIRWSSQVPKENKDEDKEHGKQSFKWFHEYNYIFNFIDIVFDYVYKVGQELEGGLK